MRLDLGPLLLLGLLSITAAGCVHEVNLHTGAATARRVRAAAPLGFTPAALGVPLDADFNPLVGGGAGPLFDGDPSCSNMGTWDSARGVIQSRQELKANARAWFAEGNVGTQQEHTYAYYRAMQLTEVCEIPPGTPIKPAPHGAVYLATKVWRGHSYTVVVHGESRAFTAGLGVNFVTFGASASTFAKQHNLEHTGIGRGLQPASEDALFSDPTNVAANYKAVRDEPDAIVVEYTQIPGVVVESDPAPEPERVIEVRFVSLHVRRTGADLFSSSPWQMKVQCSVNGQPEHEPVVFVNSSVSVGTMSTSFSRQIHARDADTIECKVWGTYERHIVKVKNLGPGTTGPIRVKDAPRSADLEGADAFTSYSITWSATPVP
jgi:hypothetical protein